MATGRVIGGDFHGAIVSPGSKGTLFIQVAFKRRKLDSDNIVSWKERPTQSNATASAVGRAVTGAVLPRVISKSASAAVGAAIETTARSSHTVEVNWADGKHSLIKLPESLFTHFSFLLQAIREPDSEAKIDGESAGAGNAPADNPTVSEQAFSLVSGIIKDRLSNKETAHAPEALASTQPNVAEQLLVLADLREKGILSEEEFAAKKSSLIEKL